MRPAAARFQKRLAHDLRRVRDRDPIEIFVQRADQNRLPEALDGLLGLPVAAAANPGTIRRYLRRDRAPAPAMARPIASLSARLGTRPAETTARCATARAARQARSPRLGRRARETSGAHTSESCPRLRCAGRSRSGSCSSRAAHAGSCPQFRRCRDADRKRLARRDKGGAQTGSRETRFGEGATGGQPRQGRLRRPRLWEIVSSARVITPDASPNPFPG